MATLREIQFTLQEKLEQLQQRDKHIQVLKATVAMKDNELEDLRKQLAESRDLFHRLAQMNSHQQETINKLTFQLQQLQQESHPQQRYLRVPNITK